MAVANSRTTQADASGASIVAPAKDEATSFEAVVTSVPAEVCSRNSPATLPWAAVTSSLAIVGASGSRSASRFPAAWTECRARARGQPRFAATAQYSQREPSESAAAGSSQPQSPTQVTSGRAPSYGEMISSGPTIWRTCSRLRG